MPVTLTAYHYEELSPAAKETAVRSVPAPDYDDFAEAANDAWRMAGFPTNALGVPTVDDIWWNPETGTARPAYATFTLDAMGADYLPTHLANTYGDLRALLALGNRPFSGWIVTLDTDSADTATKISISTDWDDTDATIEALTAAGFDTDDVDAWLDGQGTCEMNAIAEQAFDDQIAGRGAIRDLVEACLEEMRRCFADQVDYLYSDGYPRDLLVDGAGQDWLFDEHGLRVR